jgi:tRNA pseudouridine synthase 10
LERSSAPSEVLDKAIFLLRRYSLCDSCLGRAFARLAYGMSNQERGKAIKTAILMEIDRLIKEHKLGDLTEVKELLENLGELASAVYWSYFRESLKRRKCHICDDLLPFYKERFYEEAVKALSISEKPSFSLGVKLTPEIKDREESFATTNQLKYYESIKAEIRREVGKRLRIEGYPVDLDHPEAEIVFDLQSMKVAIYRRRRSTLFIYLRAARGLPISTWSPGERRSLESILGRKVYTPFAEPPDVRILYPYPVVIQEEVDHISVNGFYFQKIGEIDRKGRRLLNEMRPRTRRYRVTVFSETSLEKELQAIPLGPNLYDIYVSVADYEELLSKLKGLEVVAVDLIQVEGKYKDFLRVYKGSVQRARRDSNPGPTGLSRG